MFKPGYNPVCYRGQYGHEQSIDQCLKQDTIHMSTILWTIIATTTGCNLVCYVNWTIAIYWSMPQTGHDPHGYIPVNCHLHYHWVQSRLLCQLDNIHLFINASNRTRSTRLQSRELSTPLYWARSCLLCQPDNSNQLINVSTGHNPHIYNLVNYQRGVILFATQLDNSYQLINVSTGHNPHSYNLVNYQRHYTGHDLVCYVNWTIAINGSMSQQDTIHTATSLWSELSTPLYWTWSRLLCQLDNSNQLINVSTGHNPHSYNPVNYQRHYTGGDRVCYVNRTIAIVCFYETKLLSTL